MIHTSLYPLRADCLDDDHLFKGRLLRREGAVYVFLLVPVKPSLSSTTTCNRPWYCGAKAPDPS